MVYSDPKKQAALERLIDALAKEIVKDYRAGKEPEDYEKVRLTKPRKPKGPTLRVKVVRREGGSPDSP